MSGRRNIWNLNEKLHWEREDWFTALLVLFSFAAIAGLGIRKTLGLNDQWFDLGTMTQSIASVLRGEPLMTSDSTAFTSGSRLAGHVEIIYFALAPFLKLFPSPLTLIILQAALHASGGIAFYKIGTRLRDKRAGLLGALLYLWYPVALSATLNAIHGDTLAMAFLAWALEGAVSQRWRRYSVWTALALLSKVYVVLPVVLMGFVLWKKGFRKVGIATVVLAGAWGLIAFVGIRSLYAQNFAESTETYLKLRYSHPASSISADWQTRILIYALVLPFIFIPAFSNIFRPSLWLLPAIGILLPALATSFEYNYCSHHYALTVPFLVLAIMESSDAKAPTKWRWNPLLGISAFAAFLLIILFFFPVCYPVSSLENLVRSSSTERHATLQPWIETHLPSNAPIVISSNWSPFFAFRPEIYQTILVNKLPRRLLDFEEAEAHVDFFLVDTFFEKDSGAHLSIEEKSTHWLLTHPEEVSLSAARDGIILFATKPESASMRWIQPAVTPSPNLARDMENGLALDAASMKATFTNGEWDIRFIYIWEALGNRPIPEAYAVTTLEGYPSSRALHLGSWSLSPPSEWEPHHPIKEIVPLTLPHRPGCYPIVVGWYTPDIQAFAGSDAALQGKRVLWGYFWMGKTPGNGEWKKSCP